MKIIQVKVKPNARVAMPEEMGDGTWLARVKALPVDGKANEELVALIAREFNRRKSQVSVRTGSSGRVKLVNIEDD